MKVVWVLESVDYEQSQVLGVFRSKDKAIGWARESYVGEWREWKPVLPVLDEDDSSCLFWIGGDEFFLHEQVVR